MRLGVIITVIALALLMVAAAVGPYFIPTTTYQNIIEDALTQRLNAKVVIDDFRLRLIPYPGYTIKGFKLLSKDQPFQDLQAVSAEKINGSLRIISLLRGNFDTAVDARDVVINYRSQSGISNLGMILGIKKPSSDAEPSTAPSMPLQEMPADDSKEPAKDAPKLKEIPAMPAPSIEVPVEKGGVSLKRILHDLVAKNALAESADTEAIGSDEKLRLRKIEVVRGQINIDAESAAKPITINDVSISAKNLSIAKGLGAQIKLTGILGDSFRPNLKIDGQVFADGARQEISGQGIRAYLNGAQLVADISANLGVSPPSYDIHVATLDLNPDAFAPVLAFMGKKLPFELSWQGSVGADVSFKGTRDAAQLSLQLDATQARVLAAKDPVKEPGIALKAQAEALVGPDSYVIERGTLTLAGSALDIKGDVRRDEDIKAHLDISGKDLTLAAMQIVFPWLSEIGSIEGGSVDLVVDGPLARSKELKVEGKIEASKTELAGISLSDISSSFERDEEKISFITLKGKFAEANLSGNGYIELGASPEMDFDVVIKDIDAERIPIVRNAISGKASLVVNAYSSGKERDDLIKNLTLEGTLVSASTTIKGLAGAAGAFSQDTWKELEEKTQANLQEASEKALESTGDEVSDLMAAYDISNDTLELSEVSWSSNKYNSLIKATVAPTGEIVALGALVVEKGLSEKLVGDAEAKKKLLKKGKLIIPVVGSGKLGEPKLKLDSAKLIALIEDRLKPRPEPAKEIVEKEEVKKEEKKEAVVEKPEKKKAEPVKRAKRAAPAKVRKRRPRRAPARKVPDQDVEDILKVIIGQ